MTAAAAPRDGEPARSARLGGDRPLSIGEVLAELRGDFPEVTISKLRFLEAEGLVEPHRAPSGYRKYGPDHLTRLRFILAAQRDRYLPLRVIRAQLDALDRGERTVGSSRPGPASPSSSPSSSPPSPSGPAGPGDVHLTRAELIERSGLDEPGLASLEQYGLLAPEPDGRFDGEALTVARAAALLGTYGLEARHLRPYRAAADREVGLLAQVVAPMARAGRPPGGRALADETVHELAALCAELHAALVRSGLRRSLG